jgi:hypothetical protein
MNQKRAEREGAGVPISAKDLYRAYESNEAEADKLYQGKMVIVTGTRRYYQHTGDGPAGDRADR